MQLLIKSHPHPLHSGQRLSKSWNDKVIQAPNEEPIPFTPTRQIVAIDLMAQNEDDLLVLVESQLGQNGCVEQGGGNESQIFVVKVQGIRGARRPAGRPAGCSGHPDMEAWVFYEF